MDSELKSDSEIKKFSKFLMAFITYNQDLKNSNFNKQYELIIKALFEIYESVEICKTQRGFKVILKKGKRSYSLSEKSLDALFFNLLRYIPYKIGKKYWGCDNVISIFFDFFCWSFYWLFYISFTYNFC